MSEPLAFTTLDGPVGTLTLVASEAGLRMLLFAPSARKVDASAWVWQPDHPVLVRAARELGEYFAGARTTFDVPLDLRGTPFQRAVWGLLREIPYGATTTYGALAEKLGGPTKTRAVGGANGRNPVGIIVPCHRVVGASGALTGFAGGLDVKAYLLRLERRYAPVETTGQGDLFAAV
ncbi:methylated-DNA--[protein]-cysteine S-methyltransferase [Rhodocaloribacter sp.]